VQGKRPELAFMGGLSHRAEGKSMLRELLGSRPGRGVRVYVIIRNNWLAA
jgi:hypothetical protein